jgi:hypothetical protein
MPSKYQTWLTFNGGTEKICFPVLPEIINIQNGSGNTSVNIAGLGEVTIKQDPAAAVSFGCFFPAADFPGTQVSPPPDSKTLLEKIGAWKNSDKLVHFLITGTQIYAGSTSMKNRK